MGRLLLPVLLLAASLGWSSFVAAAPQGSASPTVIIAPNDPSVTPNASINPNPSTTNIIIPITTTTPPAASSPAIVAAAPPTSTAPILTGPAGVSVVIYGTPVVAGLPAAVISGTTWSLAPSGTELFINGTPTPVAEGVPALNGGGTQAPLTPTDANGNTHTQASPGAQTQTQTDSHGSSVKTPLVGASTKTGTGAGAGTFKVDATHTISQNSAQHTDVATTTNGKGSPQHTPATIQGPNSQHSGSGGNSPSPVSSGAVVVPSSVDPGSFFKGTSTSSAAAGVVPLSNRGGFVVVVLFGLVFMLV